MGTVVVVQEIVTSWSKQSRGAPGAVARNRVPLTAPVPGSARSAQPFSVLLHRLAFPETRTFERFNERLTVAAPDDELIVGCVRIAPDPELTRVTFRYDLSGGFPERWSQPRTKRLLPGEWGQVRYNGRFVLGWESYWSYEKHVVNVGLFSHPEGAVFERTPASFCIEALALLL